MCKYNTYAIEIIHLNGNKQLREADDNTSYKETLALYHDVKENYINKDVVINFMGYADNKQGIIFTKKNTFINNDRQNIEDLINVIVEASQELQEQYKHISGKQGYYDKKKSSIDHLFIEAADIEELTIEEKAQIFDEIREVNLLRRDYKILGEFIKQTSGSLNTIVQESRNISNKYNNKINRHSEKLKSLIYKKDNARDVHLIKEIPYKDFKDRMNIMKKVEKEYDRVIHFPERKVIACYNRCYR